MITGGCCFSFSLLFFVCFDFTKPSGQMSTPYLILPPHLLPLWLQQSHPLQLSQLPTPSYQHLASSPQQLQVSSKLVSDSQHPKVICANLNRETRLSRVTGSFFYCHPIDVVPKKNSQEWGTIYHLSYPGDNSIYDHIPKNPYYLHYVRSRQN